MSHLNTEPSIGKPDELYELLSNAGSGLSAAERLHAGARLILLLANHIGDEEVIREAVAIATQGQGVLERDSHT